MPLGLCDYIIVHLKSIHALYYNNTLNIETYFRTSDSLIFLMLMIDITPVFDM